MKVENETINVPNFFPVRITHERRVSGIDTYTHHHVFIEMLYNIDGHMLLDINNSSFDIEPGQLIFINSYDLHSTRVAGIKNEYYVLQFDPVIIERFGVSQVDWLLLSDENKVLPAENKYVKPIADCLHEIFCFDDPQEPSARLHIIGSILQIAVYFQDYIHECLVGDTDADIDKRVARSEFLINVLQFIENNYKDDISTKDVADHMHLSSNYFCRIFHEKSGRTFMDELQRYRLRKANELIANSNMRIMNIAYEVGFKNVTYFNKMYKKYFGTTPLLSRHTTQDLHQ